MPNIIHEDTHVRIILADEPEFGAFHAYQVVSIADGTVLTEVRFQKGPIGQTGVNGCQHAHLLKMIQHRLDCFQAGKFASSTNEVTCGFVSAALASEETRTRRRTQAGVEGTSQPANGVELPPCQPTKT